MQNLEGRPNRDLHNQGCRSIAAGGKGQGTKTTGRGDPPRFLVANSKAQRRAGHDTEGLAETGEHTPMPPCGGLCLTREDGRFAQSGESSILTTRKPRRFARARGYVQDGGGHPGDVIIAQRPPTVKPGAGVLFRQYRASQKEYAPSPALLGDPLGEEGRSLVGRLRLGTQAYSL